LKEEIAERNRTEETLRSTEEKYRIFENAVEGIYQSTPEGRFITARWGMAHDFNNILTAITGYSEPALRRLPEDSPLRRNIGNQEGR
jgi:PAS domain-containing protein